MSLKARAETAHPSHPSDMSHGDIRIWGQLPTSHCHAPGHAHVHRDPTEIMKLAAEPQSAGLPANRSVQRASSSGHHKEAGTHTDSEEHGMLHRLTELKIVPGGSQPTGSITWLGRAWSFPPQNTVLPEHNSGKHVALKHQNSSVWRLK